jgi:tyrosine-protein kinase Etk/Wzc
LTPTQLNHDINRDAHSNLTVALHALVRKPRILGSGLLAGGLLGMVIAFVLPPTYTARATFIPPANSSEGASLLASQLGALTGMGSSFGAAKDPGAIYVGILSSRTVADQIIAQFNLESVYKRDKLSQTEKALAAHVKVMENKDGMIAVTVDDHDPKRAADMTNALLQALMKQNDRLALTEASQRRVFFEQQLIKEKNALADAEVALTETEEKTGMIHPTVQAQLQIEAIAQTRTQIANVEIQLASLGQGETADNPTVVRLNTQLSSLRSQLSHLEGAGGGTGDVVMPAASKTPALQEEYVRKERDVKFHEALFDLLLREYENAKLDEARNAPMIQIVDQAVVPDTKSGPQRKLVVAFFALLGLLSAALAVSARALSQEVLSSNPDPEPPHWGTLLHHAAGKRFCSQIARPHASQTP